MTQLEFEGMLMEAMIYQRHNGWHTISLRGNYHNAVPLLVGACLEGRATITSGQKRLDVKDIYAGIESGVVLHAHELTEDAT